MIICSRLGKFSRFTAWSFYVEMPRNWNWNLLACKADALTLNSSIKSSLVRESHHDPIECPWLRWTCHFALWLARFIQFLLGSASFLLIPGLPLGLPRTAFFHSELTVPCLTCQCSNYFKKICAKVGRLQCTEVRTSCFFASGSHPLGLQFKWGQEAKTKNSIKQQC